MNDDDVRWVDDTQRLMVAVTFGIATDAAGNQALVVHGEDSNGIEHRWLVPTPLARRLPDALSATLDELD